MVDLIRTLAAFGYGGCRRIEGRTRETYRFFGDNEVSAQVLLRTLRDRDLDVVEVLCSFSTLDGGMIIVSLDDFGVFAEDPDFQTFPPLAAEAALPC